MGRNKKITFSLKPVLSYFGGCFVFVCLFFKERTAILRFEHCHKRKKNRSDRSRGMKMDIFPLHPVCS